LHVVIDVNANMAFKWLRDPRFKPSADDLPLLLPVEVLPDASPGAAMANSDAVALGSRIGITLSNGLSLCVSGSFDPDAVSRLVRGVAS
jgi:transposase